MARNTKKAGHGARKLHKGKKLEATKPLGKVNVSDISVTKQLDASSNNLGNASAAPSK